ncbi:hypothetical protein HRbin29_00523 [bacterium HR29]|nr:hypothetical protein HRbin29_00523 [bacterium HR29]
MHRCGGAVQCRTGCCGPWRGSECSCSSPAAVDAVLHARDAALAEREHVFSLSNPGHALVGAGLALASVAFAAGAVRWATERTRLSPRAGRAIRLTALPILASAAAVSLWLGSTVGQHSHPDEAGAEASEGHAHESDTAVAAVPEGARTGTAAEALHLDGSHGHTAIREDSGMESGSAHFHGQEVAVTASQLRAAAEFHARVVEATRKYEDIAQALAAGYVQITQDLPGIAAHFYHPAYARDGELMNPDKPETLLYTKRLDGTWRLVGVMFTGERVTETPPSYFGALDVWHRHENLCFLPGGRVSVAPNTAACSGLFVAVTPWNLHVWIVEGSSGVFAHDLDLIDPGPYPGAVLPAAADVVAAGQR